MNGFFNVPEFLLSQPSIAYRVLSHDSLGLLVILHNSVLRSVYSKAFLDLLWYSRDDRKFIPVYGPEVGWSWQQSLSYVEGCVNFSPK